MIDVDGHPVIDRVVLETCTETAADYRAIAVDDRNCEISAEFDRSTAMQVLARMDELASVDFSQRETIEAVI